MRHEVTDSMVSRAIPERAYPEEWDIPMLHEEVLRVLALDLPLTDWAKEEGIADEEIRARLIDAGNRKMAEKAAHYTPDVMRMAEKSILLQILDQTWKDHLLSLDHLRQGINLRSYAQRDPLNEYKSEAFSLFEQMLVQLRENVTQTLSHLELSFDNPENMDLMPAPMLQSDMYETRFDPTMNLDEEDEGNDALIDGPAPQTVRHASGDALDPTNPVTWGKVSRNAPCPCGSGKKYKHCHGQLV